MTIQNTIQTTIFQNLPPFKHAPSGWLSFNCPACIHNGQSRNDSKGRGGILFTPGGGFSYHCFNCDFKTRWEPGLLLHQYIRKLMSWLKIDSSTIQKLAFEAFKLRETLPDAEVWSIEQQKTLLPENLPPGSQHYTYWLNQETPPQEFKNVIQYFFKRNNKIFEWYNDFYWTPGMPKRLIFPLKYKDQFYGYTARYAGKPPSGKLKYLNSSSSKFLFNSDRLFDKSINNIIVTEGVLDAIAVNGVSVLGNEMTDFQINWINNSRKNIILLPDRDKAGTKLIEQAIGLGWKISLPRWDSKIKDAFQAVEKYGRIFTTKLIVDNAEINPLKINIALRDWINK